MILKNIIKIHTGALHSNTCICIRVQYHKILFVRHSIKTCIKRLELCPENKQDSPKKKTKQKKKGNFTSYTFALVTRSFWISSYKKLENNVTTFYRIVLKAMFRVDILLYYETWSHLLNRSNGDDMMTSHLWSPGWTKNKSSGFTLICEPLMTLCKRNKTKHCVSGV